MFKDSTIASCIDLARGITERNGYKDPKYYEPTFAARVFGAFSKPKYPKETDISSLEELWVQFRPKSASNEQNAELLSSWISILGLSENLTATLLLDRVNEIQARHKVQYSEGVAKGVRYTFMDPFHTIVREIDAKRNEISAGQSQALIAEIIEEVKSRWLYFRDNIHLNSDVSLAKEIDIFVVPIKEFIGDKYPELLNGPSDAFWLSIFMAILDSGTHSKDEVNTAIADLQKKYAHKV